VKLCHRCHRRFEQDGAFCSDCHALWKKLGYWPETWECSGRKPREGHPVPGELVMVSDEVEEPTYDERLADGMHLMKLAEADE
jgi:hypothetical protein